ncbi:hypothetical protein HETIRDRAFT_168395 [Heterobasidion irregulare TC 32-1]|uniref:Uncharacterized protein n=1 Tax=Heterobasidion irregulare (strain TC 32-1) TaxID=747525 RepID=W4KJ99_HETIT|nr:uncharacterized protein HETIRDRAFT_168395 [Heterobasidion irregulare TC 32-1]ETW85390.1 hypothetical protein HETIRDRAFT_168395 [Heterobasidion irregulare TC 32-1]
MLSSSDFPALTAQPPQPSITATSEQLLEQPYEDTDNKAAERAAKQAERAAEKARLAAERKVSKEKEKAGKRVERERLAQERLENEREKAREEAKAEKLRLERTKATMEKLRLEKERTRLEKEKEKEKEKAAQLVRVKANEGKRAAATLKQVGLQNAAQVGQAAPFVSPRKGSRQPSITSKTLSGPALPAPELVSQGPLLSKMPKKNRPVTKPIRIPKEEESLTEPPSALASAATSEAPQLPIGRGGSMMDTNSASSRGQSMERTPPNERTSVKELLEEIELQNPSLNLAEHPFFDLQKINPAAKMPLEYGPLVHALSALSVGGGSFANNMPSGSIDNAVSSFQQLLETLTQTISDLLRLLPRTTWDDSSSFDGVLRDMLKGDDFLDEGGEEGNGKDEVAALTLALERRARWMEVQLSKLEELHRDINTAAVRAVLSFNDNGWDPHGFAPRMGNTLQKFDLLGMVSEGAVYRPMMVDELEKKLVVAKEAAVFAETEVREAMEKMQELKPVDLDYY